MLKNIVFDFGNVVMNYDPDKILDHYDLSSADHELLKKVIFQSEEWLEIDRGNLSEDEHFEKSFSSSLSKSIGDSSSYSGSSGGFSGGSSGGFGGGSGGGAF